MQQSRAVRKVTLNYGDTELIDIPDQRRHKALRSDYPINFKRPTTR